MRSKRLALKITYDCPGHCLYCTPRKKLWKTRGGQYMQKELIDRIFETLSLQDFGIFEEIQLSGGEPSSYKHIKYLLSSCMNSGLPVSITTSGWADTKGSWRDIFTEFHVDKFYISLDDINPYQNDHIRGAGSHKRALKAIHDALISRDITGWPEITIISVIHHLNIHHLKELARYIRDSGVNRWMPAYLECISDNKDLALTINDLLWLQKERTREPFLDRLLGYTFKNEHIPWNILVDGVLPKHIKTKKCPSLGRLAIIHPNGNVYSCYGSEYKEIKPIASFFEGQSPCLRDALSISRQAARYPGCSTCLEPYQQSLVIK